MKISLIWQGLNGRYGQWQDGLYAALKLIEQEHTVAYFDVDQLDKLKEFNPDVVLYWEAPCTLKGKDADKYRAVMNLPYKKALLFAGGPVERETCKGFDLYFVESKINEEEFEALGLPWKRAFGVNDQVFKPDKQPKVFDGMLQATCASWKRQWLLAEAFRDRALLCGRFQETDPQPFIRSREFGALVLPELPAEAVASLINASKAVVNTSEFWGGGQRATIESLACGTPAIVMNDSPKNREFIEESGAGIVCDPNPNAIREALTKLTPEMSQKGIDYIKSKYTSRHYADAILEGVQSIL